MAKTIDTVKPMVTGVHHAALSVPDLETARRFYVDLLGGEKLSEVNWDRGDALIDEIVGLKDSAARSEMIRIGNLHVELFEYSAPDQPEADPRPPANRYGYTHLGFQVTDIHAVYDRMVAAGLEFHREPFHAGDAPGQGYWATYGRDFFGNIFELNQFMENSDVAPL